jgi:hypothetical protein
VLGTLVNHLQQRGDEDFGQSGGDAVGAGAHATSVGAPRARENPLCKTSRRPHISCR